MLVCRRKTDLTFTNRICHIKHYISKYIQVVNLLKYLSNTNSTFMLRYCCVLKAPLDKQNSAPLKKHPDKSSLLFPGVVSAVGARLGQRGQV